MLLKLSITQREGFFEEFGIELEEEVKLVESSSAYGWKVSGT
jgi:UDP-N-acetylenolpyruvoylglucosamine reductase